MVNRLRSVYQSGADATGRVVRVVVVQVAGSVDVPDIRRIPGVRGYSPIPNTQIFFYLNLSMP